MSSHREAPAISKDPVADNTDTYAFVSPDDPGTVTIIANYLPLEAPFGGPNFFEFGPDVRYRINIDHARNSRLEISEIYGVAQDRLRRSDPELPDATGIDQAEVSQVGLQVDGEAVQRDAVPLSHADRGDLSSPLHRPDAHVPVTDLGGHTNFGERSYDGELERADIARHRETPSSQANDWIADELARPVIGHQPAARRAGKLNRACAQLSLRCVHVRQRSAPTQRDHRRVLEKQQCVRYLFSEPLFDQVVL